MCFRLKSLWKTYNPATEEPTPETSRDLQISKTGDLNLTNEYETNVRTESYEEFWIKFQRAAGHENRENGETSDSSQLRSNRFLTELLSPDQESVNAILQHRFLASKPELYNLVSGYFNNSEDASKLCSLLQNSIDRARKSYSRIKIILDIVPITGDFSEEQCHWIIGEFTLLMQMENPFPHPDSGIFQSIHNGFQNLLDQLEVNRKRVRRKLKLIKRFKKGSVVCLVGMCTAVAICAVVIGTHALVAIVAGPVFITFPIGFIKKLRFESLNLLSRHNAQMDAAAKGSYVLNKDLDTMNRLVTRLHDEVDHNKDIIRFCLDRKYERHPVQEVVRQLRKNDSNFIQQLDELEQRVCLCLNTINRARSLLVQEIYMHQQENNDV
eukprot:Gb_12696 [translate_table: standard]